MLSSKEHNWGLMYSTNHLLVGVVYISVNGGIKITALLLVTIFLVDSTQKGLLFFYFFFCSIPTLRVLDLSGNIVNSQGAGYLRKLECKHS